MVIQYIRIMINLNLGEKGLILFIVGLVLSLISVHIENNTDVVQYGFSSKIVGMSLNNIGIAIMALGAVLLGTSRFKNKNIK